MPDNTTSYSLLRTADNDGNLVTPQDTLPGYPDAKIAQYKTDLGAFYQIQTTQSGAQQDASESRQDFETQASQISRRRRKLQHGLDAERPHGAANTPLRRRLGLPTDKAMS